MRSKNMVRENRTRLVKTYQGKKLVQIKLENKATPPDVIPTQREGLCISYRQGFMSINSNLPIKEI